MVTHCNYSYIAWIKQIKCAASRRTSKKDTQTLEATKQTLRHPSKNIHLSTRCLNNGMTMTHCPKSTICRATIPRTKVELRSTRIMVSTQLNSLLIKRYPNLTKGQKSTASPGLTSLRSLKMCSKDSTGLPGSRRSMSIFQNLSMQQG